MNDLEKLQEILNNQPKSKKNKYDWDDCSLYEVTKDEVRKRNYERYILKMKNDLCIGFVFDRNKRFVGIYNWKE